MIKRSEYQNAKSVSELWTYEKSTFRPWIIIAGVGIGLWFLLCLAVVIIHLAASTQIIEYWKNFYIELSKKGLIQTNPTNLNNSSFDTQILLQVMSQFVILAILVAFTAAFYATSITKSYKFKDFSNISGFVSFTIIASTILYIWGYISALFGNVSAFQSFNNLPPLYRAGQIIFIVSQVFIVIFYFAIYREIIKIKKAFLYVKAAQQAQMMQKQFFEMLKHNQEFMHNYNAYTQATTSTEDSTNQAQGASEDNSTNNPVPNPEDIKNNPEIKKMLSLPNEQLYEIARILKIYGYDKMSKEKLAETIYSITKNAKSDHEMKDGSK